MKVRIFNPQIKTERYGNNFNNLLNEFINHPHATENCNCNNVWAPRVNIAESKYNFLLKMDLPGLTEKEVKITSHGDKLHIEVPEFNVKETVDLDQTMISSGISPLEIRSIYSAAMFNGVTKASSKLSTPCTILPKSPPCLEASARASHLPSTAA